MNIYESGRQPKVDPTKLQKLGTKFYRKKTIEDIPDEVMVGILGQLDDRNLQDASRVSKKWLGLAKYTAAAPKKAAVLQLIKNYKLVINEMIETDADNKLDKSELKKLEKILNQLEKLEEKTQQYHAKKLGGIKEDFADIQFELIEILKHLNMDQLNKLGDIQVDPSLDHIVLCCKAYIEACAEDKSNHSGIDLHLKNLLHQSNNTNFLVKFILKTYPELHQNTELDWCYVKILLPFFLEKGEILKAIGLASKCIDQAILNIAHIEITNEIIKKIDVFLTGTSLPRDSSSGLALLAYTCAVELSKNKEIVDDWNVSRLALKCTSLKEHDIAKLIVNQCIKKPKNRDKCLKKMADAVLKQGNKELANFYVNQMKKNKNQARKELGLVAKS